MTVFGYSGLILAITSAILVVIILRYGKSEIHKIWALFNISIVIWGTSCYFIGNETSKYNALILWRISHIGIIFIPVFLYHFVNLIGKIESKIILGLIYVQSLVFLNLDFTSFFFPGVRYVFDSFYYAVPGVIYPAFTFIWMFIVAFSHFLLFKIYLKSEGIRKNQILYLFAGSLIGFSGGITNFLIGFGVNVYPIGNFTIPIYCLIVTFAILRYRLLDISIAFTRTSIFLAVYSLVLGIPFAIAFGWKDQLIQSFSQSWWIIPLLSSTLLATIGPYIYIYIQRKAEDKLLEEQRRYQSTLRQASLGMGQIKDLKRLLNLIVHVVTRAVRIQHCEIYLLHEESKQYILKASKGRKFDPLNVNTLSLESALVKRLNKIKEPIVYDEVRQQSQDYRDVVYSEMESALKRMDAAVAVPSFIEQRMIAIIMLGKKRSGKLYSQDDLAVFSILANQSALAIENAEFYEDMKKTHEQLFKAEKMATLGTMADGLSHQINNRLHALGFIAGDVLDTIKLKKSDKNPKETKKLLDEVQNGLERIQENVKRGGEIVEGLLKYSRKGEEGFESVDLAELIKASIEMAQFKIKLDQINIVRNFNHNTPKIYGNFTQLQEVFFNLIDNAYDATMQRKEELKEPGYQPKLEITANPKGKKIEFIISDNGLGVKPDDLHKLFTPFFTTKLSSRKGTGLGLYVIRQIIEENHHGKVEFASKYKVGLKTQILLPVVREEKKT